MVNQQMKTKLMGYAIILSSILVYALAGYSLYALYNYIFDHPAVATKSKVSSSDVSVRRAQKPAVPVLKISEASSASGAAVDKQEEVKMITIHRPAVENTDKTVMNARKNLQMLVCPPRTHWDASRGKCLSNQPACSSGMHWNGYRRECVQNNPSCPPLTHWNEPRGTCVSNQIQDCALGQSWNLHTERCETNH